MILLFIIMRMKVLKEMGCDDLKVSLDTTVQWVFFLFYNVQCCQTKGLQKFFNKNLNVGV